MKNKMTASIKTILLLIVTQLVLSGCVGGGAETSVNPVTVSPGVASYTGPSPQTDDVQSFKLTVWENLKSTTRCGGCHGTTQTPKFVDPSDVNAAYSAVVPFVNLSSPADSRLVTKVAGGHNCWLESAAQCGLTIQGLIAAWAGSSLGGSGNEIQLTAPAIKDAGSSKNFPVSSASFAATIHPLLMQRCVGCHVESSSTPQQPYFAQTNADAAYAAAQSKIDLETPSSSRFVVRLRSEFHNCWTDCASNSTEMQTAITNFSNGITPTAVDTNLVISKALLLSDGIAASSGGRHEDNLIALYNFKQNDVLTDLTVYDEKPNALIPKVNLTMSGSDIELLAGGGLRVGSGMAKASTSSSEVLFNQIATTGEYTIEAWVAPANVTQEGPAAIVSYAGSNTENNFLLGQTLYNYDFFARSSQTNLAGSPQLSTPDADEVLQATLQHTVVTFKPNEGRKIYVNGALINVTDSITGGTLSDWDNSYAFVMGNSVSNDRQWQGILRMVAIHNRALTQTQISDNFEVGVGEKFFLLFSVANVTGVADSFVVFEVSQYDSYSYLFNAPFFISLDPTATPDNIAIKGIRIGINGREATVGQAYANVDFTVTSQNYNPLGTPLSSVGTIIALEKGVLADEFFLTFDQLGASQYVRVEAAPAQPAAPGDLPTKPTFGLRTFDEINATLSVITGVPVTNTNAQNTFNTVKQGLPTVEDIDTFLSAQQMAITQVAIEYCSELVESSSLRQSFFGNFGFTSDVATAFGTGDSAAKNQILDVLYDKAVGANYSDMPSKAFLKDELIFDTGGVNGAPLYDRLTANCPTGCDAARTRTIVKALCSAVLGSGTMLIQ